MGNDQGTCYFVCIHNCPYCFGTVSVQAEHPCVVLQANQSAAGVSRHVADSAERVCWCGMGCSWRR